MPLTITLSCRVHPRYSAIKRPTADCAACLAMFDARQTIVPNLTIMAHPPRPVAKVAAPAPIGKPPAVIPPIP